MKTKITYLILGFGLLITLACTKYPPDTERLLEDLAIITQYDTRIDFNNYKTYAIASSIVKITAKDTIEETSANAIAILDQIAANMEARGYVPVVPPAKPDFGIQVIYYENTYVYTYYYDWWGYYPYWGYYYPYYPVYYSSYSTGMLNIELVDLKNVDPTHEKLYLRWNAFIRGILNTDHTLSEVKASVDQAFKQTPQLKTNAN